MRLLGEKLRNARDAKNLSQERAAESTSGGKMAAKTLSRLESGKGNPTLQTLGELAAVYGTTVSALLKGTEEDGFPTFDEAFFWLERYRGLPPDHKAFVATILSNDLSYLNGIPELLPVARELLKHSAPKKQGRR